MALKYFCDECQKEIKSDAQYFMFDIRGKNFGRLTYCLKCFKKHWQGKLPKDNS